jgi:hypothetical protein
MTKLRTVWIQDAQNNEVSLYMTDNGYSHSVSTYEDSKYSTQGYGLKTQRIIGQEVYVTNCKDISSQIPVFQEPNHCIHA